jgi:hypothetical protein
MDCIARAKQSTSFGLSVVLVFTADPGVGTGMAYQSTAPRLEAVRLQLPVITDRRARDHQ